MTKLYNCFHDHGSMPKDKYISPLRPALLCGADLEWRHHEDIQNILRDNTGENISKENTQYSELTGYYWIWKNENVDVVGIEHYRRHFIKHDAQITDYVHSEDLLTEQEILNLLAQYDFIVPVHQTLANTSIYDLYKICFQDQATDIVKYMKQYFTENTMNTYLDTLYEYMSHNYLIRANMLIASKQEFDQYCSVMFDMIDYLKQVMTVKPDSRVWGYITELFPYIYLKANNKKFIEVDIAVDDMDWETKKDRVYVTMNQKEEPFDKKDPNIQIEFFKSL